MKLGALGHMTKAEKSLLFCPHERRNINTVPLLFCRCQPRILSVSVSGKVMIRWALSLRLQDRDGRVWALGRILAGAWARPLAGAQANSRARGRTRARDRAARARRARAWQRSRARHAAWESADATQPCRRALLSRAVCVHRAGVANSRSGSWRWGETIKCKR